MANKSTGALKYYAIDVNMRSALAEHGEACVGRCALLCLYCAEQVNGGDYSGLWNMECPAMDDPCRIGG